MSAGIQSIRRTRMRFMMLMIPKGYDTAAPGTMPAADAVAAMMKYNEAPSREEAIAWAKRCPASSNEIIEIRQVQEMSDFPADVQEAAAGFTELQGKFGR